MKFPPQAALRQLLQTSLREDIGRKDVTTDLLIQPGQRCEAHLIAKSSGVISGLPLVRSIYRQFDRKVRVIDLRKDGDEVEHGTQIARVEGPLRSILTGERVALNFLSHLSGIATITKRFVDAIQPHKTQIMDTRKTLPSLRLLEKYAVRCGGGVNQRMNLYEAVMVKDKFFKNSTTLLNSILLISLFFLSRPIFSCPKITLTKDKGTKDCKACLNDFLGLALL